MDVLPHGKLPSREEATGDEQDGQCDLEAVDVRIIHVRHITVADRFKALVRSLCEYFSILFRSFFDAPGQAASAMVSFNVFGSSAHFNVRASGLAGALFNARALSLQSLPIVAKSERFGISLLSRAL